MSRGLPKEIEGVEVAIGALIVVEVWEWGRWQMVPPLEKAVQNFGVEFFGLPASEGPWSLVGEDGGRCGRGKEAGSKVVEGDVEGQVGPAGLEVGRWEARGCCM